MAGELAVLIPVYDRPAGLLASLGSLEKEAIGCDVIIVDDGSTVPLCVPETVGGYKEIVVLRKSVNEGIAAALNVGLEYIIKTGYKYVARLDSGDLVVPGRLAEQVRFLEQHPECGVVSSYTEFFDETGQVLFQFTAPASHEKILRRMHVENCIEHSASMIRVAVFQHVGVYNEGASLVEDYELFWRIARQFQLAVIPKVWTLREYNVRGLSIAGRKRQHAERLKLQLRHFDFQTWASYYGVVRSVASMCTPRCVAVGAKRILFRRRGPG